MNVLVYLHEECGVVHRDLKPDNIMVSYSQDATLQLKLIDFNTAFDLRSVNKGPTEDCIMGSTGLREWSAPETLTKLYYNAKCDSYSAGCLIVFLLRQTNGCQFFTY